jgi:hypothetical protein
VRISKQQRKVIEDYLEYLKKELALSDWHCDLMDDAVKDSTHAATTNIRNGADRSRLWLADSFLTGEFPDGTECNNLERSQTLIHEILHWHFDRAWQFVDDLFEAELGHQAKNMAQHVFKGHMEVPIDKLAYVLVKYVKLIEWPS